MGRVDITGPRGFRVEEVEVASTTFARLRGMIGRSPAPLLIPAGSVHGFHLATDLTVVALDRTGAVLEVSRLRPWRVVRVRGAHWMLELPRRHPPPQVGERLQLLARCGESDG